MTATGTPESIATRGRAAVLTGTERLHEPPAVGQPRWALSLVVRADPEAEQVLARVTDEAVELAGPGQWRTGSAGSAHVTVGYLEPAYRTPDADAPVVAALVESLRELAPGTGVLAWDLGGVALADSGVLVAARPVGGRPDAFRAAVLDRLGDHGRREAAYRGTIWWSSIVHFAEPVADRQGLVRWADRLADTRLGRLTARAAEVVRYEYRPAGSDPVGPRTVPVTLATLDLAG